jgi:hypothetical protein
MPSDDSFDLPLNETYLDRLLWCMEAFKAQLRNEAAVVGTDAVYSSPQVIAYWDLFRRVLKAAIAADWLADDKAVSYSLCLAELAICLPDTLGYHAWGAPTVAHLVVCVSDDDDTSPSIALSDDDLAFAFFVVDSMVRKGIEIESERLISGALPGASLDRDVGEFLLTLDDLRFDLRLLALQCGLPVALSPESLDFVIESLMRGVIPDPLFPVS